MISLSEVACFYCATNASAADGFAVQTHARDTVDFETELLSEFFEHGYVSSAAFTKSPVGSDADARERTTLLRQLVDELMGGEFGKSRSEWKFQQILDAEPR